VTSPAAPPPVGARVVLQRARAALALARSAAPGLLVVQVVLTAAGGVVPVGTALLAKQVFDRLAGGRPALAPLLGLAAGMAAAGLVAGTIPQALRYVTTETERRVGVRAQERLYLAVNGQPGLTRLEDPLYQDRLQLAEQASRSGPGQLVSSVLGTVQALIGVVGFLATLVVFSPVTAAVVLVAALPILRVHLALNREQAAMLWRTGHAQRRHLFFARLLTTPSVAQEVRLFGLGDFFRHRMRTELTAVNTEYRRLGLRQLRSHGVLGVLSAAVAGGGLVWMIAETAAGRATLGDVSMFIAAMTGVQAGLAGGVQNATMAHQALLLFDHYQAVVADEPDLP